MPWTVYIVHSLYEGLVNAFCEANRKGAKAAMLESGEEASSKYQLAVVDKEAAVKDYVKQNIQTVRARTRSGSTQGKFDGAAFKKGQEIGSKLNPTAKKIG